MHNLRQNVIDFGIVHLGAIKRWCLDYLLVFLGMNKFFKCFGAEVDCICSEHQLDIIWGEFLKDFFLVIVLILLRFNQAFCYGVWVNLHCLGVLLKRH